MKKVFYPDFFNDVFGPIMQPGSSGSFAGTSRVGRVARYNLKSEPKKVTIMFNPSENRMKSLGNMMDDRGFLGGLQDFATDDVRLFDAHELARNKGISYSFNELEQDSPYRGGVTFLMEGKDGDTARYVAASIGGGMIRTYVIDGFDIEWQADTYAILIWASSKNGAIFVQNAANQLISIFQQDFVTSRDVTDNTGRIGVFLEFSVSPAATDIESTFLTLDRQWQQKGFEYRILPALLPVVSTKNRKPQLFNTVSGWLEYAKQHNVSFVQAAIEYEKRFSGWDDASIWAYFEKIASILHNQIHSLENVGYNNAQDTPNLPIYGKQWNAYKQSGRVLEDPITSRILDYAFSTNAKLPGTKIVPGPMGTGGGYLMSALEGIQEARGFSHDKLIEGLIVAAGLGAVAFSRTHASGAAGCVGESGICCAMASGAITWMAGGTGTQVEWAASMALQANEGLPCDPIPGGKEFPCITRTIRASVTAPMYADMALAGIDPLIPYDQVLDAIERNYLLTPPSKLCGPTCGINCTPAAQACIQFLEGDLMRDKLQYDAPQNV